MKIYFEIQVSISCNEKIYMNNKQIISLTDDNVSYSSSLVEFLRFFLKYLGNKH